MKFDFEGTTLRIVPENNEEKKKINTLFPNHYLKTSKVIKVKEFVDVFAKPTGDKYLQIKGFDPSLVAKKEIEDHAKPSVQASQVDEVEPLGQEIFPDTPQPEAVV